MIEEPSHGSNIKQITIKIQNKPSQTEEIKEKISKSSRSLTNDDRSLHKGLAKIKEWSLILNFDEQVIDKAVEQYRKLETARDTFKGRSIEAIITAILYVASRQCECPVKPDDITTATKIESKGFRNALKYVRKYIDDEIPTLDPIKYCQSFAEKLKLSEEMIVSAKEVVNRIQSRNLLDGKNPRTIASVAIFYVTSLSATNERSLKEIASISNIKENTIKMAYNLLFCFRYEIIPEFQDRQPIAKLAIKN